MGRIAFATPCQLHCHYGLTVSHPRLLCCCGALMISPDIPVCPSLLCAVFIMCLKLTVRMPRSVFPLLTAFQASRSPLKNLSLQALLAGVTHIPTMDTTHALILLAWSEYKNNRIPGTLPLFCRSNSGPDHTFRLPDILPHGDANGHGSWLIRSKQCSNGLERKRTEPQAVHLG